jgi:hypothetical protein
VYVPLKPVLVLPQVPFIEEEVYVEAIVNEFGVTDTTVAVPSKPEVFVVTCPAFVNVGHRLELVFIYGPVGKANSKAAYEEYAVVILVMVTP